MLRAAVLAAVLVVVSANNGPMAGCEQGQMFVADVEDLCRYHWCMEDGGTVEMRCAPGSRVPTWWEKSDDYEVPCNVDRRHEVSCLRCDLPSDERLPGDPDDCIDNDCGDGCTCQDLWQSYFCLCGNPVPTFDYVAPEGDYCDPDNCVNGATCHSQWDDYWCECLNGWTGKNCEVSFCNPNPCNNGGTCVIDEVNYHCECPPGFEGECCGEGEARQTTTTEKITTTTRGPECDECTYGANCEFRYEHTCECNPCSNFDDKCTDAPEGEVRVCEGLKDMSGQPFSFIFMQNRPDDTDDRELEVYVTSAGSDTRRVKIYTPGVDPSSNCYFEEISDVAGFTVKRFKIPDAECAEQKGSRIFSDKVIKVEAVDGGDLLVYAVNRDQWSADAWIAYPDTRGAMDYFVVAYAPATYSTQFAVVALEDDTTVSVTYQGGARGDLAGDSFTLQKYQSLQIQSESDLTGTRIQSDKPIHAYSGNVRALIREVLDSSVGNITSGSRDHLIEQLPPVSSWGTEYNVMPVPNRIYGDHIRVMAAEAGTSCKVDRSDPDGRITTSDLSMGSGEFRVFDAVSDNTYRISCTNRVMVAQISKSKDATEASNDPSLIILPSVPQWANRYLFSTPEFSGGIGSARPYNTTFALLCAKSGDMDGISVANPDAGRFLASDQNIYGAWKQVPNSDNYCKAVKIEYGTNIILHQDQDVQFMCIFYGMDDRESLGFPIGMLLKDL